MTYVDVLGYAGALAVATTYSMKTMIPLRTAGIVSNCLFITYGVLTSTYPVLVLHSVLLPMNAYRLYQMLQLVKRVSAAARGDLSMDWLKPFMNTRACHAGTVLFRAGDPAESIYYTVSGLFRLREIDGVIHPGSLIGELGFVSPGNRRTLTFECVQDGELLTITYQQVKELYFQNPQFGFAFLRLVSERLFRDIDRLQAGAKVA